MDIQVGETHFKNLKKFNVILGKNGSGKSTLLKDLEKSKANDPKWHISYVTPERGGELKYDANIETSSTRLNWVRQNRSQNQWNQFKRHSITQFRKLETQTLREIEKSRQLRESPYTFDDEIDRINRLLSNIYIERSDDSFRIYKKSTDSKSEIASNQISSGESETISLAIECLAFAKNCISDQNNFLLLDEPDVHLHPDLQHKFIFFLLELAQENGFNFIIATHSTPILSAMSGQLDCAFSILADSSHLDFYDIKRVHKEVLPIFGAHPLSNIFNESPILFVEGEDDERIFQQAIRSSNGKFKVFPCSVGGVGELNEYELTSIKLLKGVYDDPKAFSLRDKDEGAQTIDDIEFLIREKLECRTAENLILSDEVLKLSKTGWEELVQKMDNWLEVMSGHIYYDELLKFKESGYNRKHYKLKSIRNIIVGLLNSSKPWEVLVGKAIGAMLLSADQIQYSEFSIASFLGKNVVERILVANTK